MKAYLFIVLAGVGMYAVFTGRAKAILCALTFGSDSILNCENFPGLTNVRNAAKGQFLPLNQGYD